MKIIHLKTIHPLKLLSYLMKLGRILSLSSAWTFLLLVAIAVLLQNTVSISDPIFDDHWEWFSILFLAIVLFFQARLFRELGLFIGRVTQQQLNTPETVSILNRLIRSCSIFFILEVLAGLLYLLSPSSRTPSDWSFGYELAEELLHLFPGLSGGGCVVGAIAFWALRDSIQSTLDLAQQKSSLEAELNLTV